MSKDGLTRREALFWLLSFMITSAFGALTIKRIVTPPSIVTKLLLEIQDPNAIPDYLNLLDLFYNNKYIPNKFNQYLRDITFIHQDSSIPKYTGLTIQNSKDNLPAWNLYNNLGISDTKSRQDLIDMLLEFSNDPRKIKSVVLNFAFNVEFPDGYSVEVRQLKIESGVKDNIPYFHFEIWTGTNSDEGYYTYMLSLYINEHQNKFTFNDWPGNGENYTKLKERVLEMLNNDFPKIYELIPNQETSSELNSELDVN